MTSVRCRKYSSLTVTSALNSSYSTTVYHHNGTSTEISVKTAKDQQRIAAAVLTPKNRSPVWVDEKKIVLHPQCRWRQRREDYVTNITNSHTTVRSGKLGRKPRLRYVIDASIKANKIPSLCFKMQGFYIVRPHAV